jgi:hypothetical protein
MAADQFEKNVEVKPGSNQRVEFAIKLPGGEGGGRFGYQLMQSFPRKTMRGSSTLLIAEIWRPWKLQRKR